MRQLMMVHTLDKVLDVPVTPGFFIRTWRPGEEEAWLEIVRCGLCAPDAGIDTWNGAILNRENIDPETDTFFVCREETGEPVATVTGYVQPDGRGDIHMVACKFTARGNKIGEFMLSHAMKKLKAEMPGEGRIVELTTDDFRVPAVVGYLRAGFHPVLYDEGMEERWRALCDMLNFHGVEMLTESGEPTGIVL